jgi:hypothetical protein
MKNKITEVSVWYRKINTMIDCKQENIIIWQLNNLIANIIIRALFYLENVYRININTYPINDKQEILALSNIKNKTSSYLLSDKMGSMLAFIDIEHVLSIKFSDERNQYLLNWFNNTIQDFAKQFNYPVCGLETAIKQISENNYFIFHSKKYSNKKNTCKIWLENSVKIENESFRMAFEKVKENKLLYFDLGTKSLERFSLEEMSFEEKLNLTISFTIQGWEKNHFYFSWGEEEKYEFNADLNELKRII